jgi:hypothetical protein
VSILCHTDGPEPNSLYVASFPPTYVAVLFQAAIPVQIELEGGCDETGGAAAVEVGLEEVGGGVVLVGGRVLVDGGGATVVGAAGVSPMLS